MKKIIYLGFIIILSILLIGCSKRNINNDITTASKEKSMQLIINNNKYEVKLEDNETVKNLIDKLPLKVKMQEFNGNEFYYTLDYSLISNDIKPDLIKKGDIYLYNGNTLVIFYETFNTSYKYTKIGNIKSVDNLFKDLNEGLVEIN